ncbi:MAG TPA: transposase [Steroidobacteraceae bacterium]|nr:transposase [Steroidobacteraceae bacterium]
MSEERNARSFPPACIVLSVHAERERSCDHSRSLAIVACRRLSPAYPEARTDGDSMLHLGVNCHGIETRGSKRMCMLNTGVSLREFRCCRRLRERMMCSMLRRQAFRFELMPSGAQRHAMSRVAGCCRFVYNEALAEQKLRYERGESKFGYAALCKQLTAWRNGGRTPWLKDAPTHPLQQALKDLERAYSNFFAGRAALPRFKKKGRGESFRYPDPKQIRLDQSNSRVFLPKLGWLRYRKSRDVLGEVRQFTVSCRAGKWFVSIQTERDLAPPVSKAVCAVGIDMGVARLATLSNGEFLAPLGSFKRHEAALRRAQQALSRKLRFSRNWHKARRRVEKIHTRIGHCRRDFLHKATTSISQNHAIVCVEDLQVRNMSRSAAGTLAAPGRNVRAKSGLNKAILDQGWFEFRRQLQYKLAWNGGRLIAVPPQGTSQTCPACGHESAANRCSQAAFHCTRCSFEDHADQVGAINILSRGLQGLRDEGTDTADAPAGCASALRPWRTARIACEVSLTQGQQQEPVEVI